jgi:hypothetical protein
MIDVRIADRSLLVSGSVDRCLEGDDHQLLRVGDRFAEAVRAAPTNTHRVAPLSPTVNDQNHEK